MHTAEDKDEIRIVPATIEDAPLIHSFIKKLAEYEKLSHEVISTEKDIRETLFGDRPYAEVLLAHVNGRPAGFALFFHNYSTFVGRPGIYIEDIFVDVDNRGMGIGKALFESVLSLVRERDCGRVEWAVLDWNKPAIRFYESFGAKPMDQWIIYRLTKENLKSTDE